MPPHARVHWLSVQTGRGEEELEKALVHLARELPELFQQFRGRDADKVVRIERLRHPRSSVRKV